MKWIRLKVDGASPSIFNVKKGKRYPLKEQKLLLIGGIYYQPRANGGVMNER